MKILFADDDSFIIDAMKLIISVEEDMDCIGSVNNGEEAISFCKIFKPDIVLMDIRMPVLDGVLATKRIKEVNPEIKVLLLTTYKDLEYIRTGIKNGASGYLLKSGSAEKIVEGIRTVFKGNVVFDKEIADLLPTLVDSYRENSEEVKKLSEKDLDLMQLISEGYSNKEIAEKRFMGEGTVRNYISAILDKLQLRDRTQLAVFYIRHCEQKRK